MNPDLDPAHDIGPKSSVEFVLLMAATMSLVALCIDAMLPAFSLIADDLEIANANDVQLILSVMFLGFAFGVLMNVYFWPYVFTPGQSEMYWQPGLTLVETLKRYALFYAVTSLWWDLARAVGNFVLLLLFAVPVVRLLRRFQQRFFFQVQTQ